MGIGIRALTVAAVLLLLGGAGCAGGAIYTRVVVPLDLNLDRTRVHQGDKQASWSTIRIPISGAFVQVDWGSDGIADAAREQGVSTIHYADLETLSVLGIWTQRWAIVYGE